MPFYADLHIHSKYSRATSRNCDLENLALWARKKGIAVIGTGDFTHPAWRAELEDKLTPAGGGLFRLKKGLDQEVEAQLESSLRTPVRFMLTVEISTIYKKNDRTRKVHHLLLVPTMAAAKKLSRALDKIGNVNSDGRPILGLDSRDLLEITLESGEGSYLIPAHVWTPWFSALGSKSGFDTIDECYADLAGHVFAIETGLSSDPPMNWRLNSLDRFRLVSNSDAHSPPKLGREANVFECEHDYFAIRNALETGQGYEGTVEFFPEEGKYHLDGHRKCHSRLTPEQTQDNNGLCPVCGKPVTVGVMNRVDELADHPEGRKPETAGPFRSLIPLNEIIGEILGRGPNTKGVMKSYHHLVSRVGPELFILESAPIEDLKRAGSPEIAEAINRMRQGRVIRLAGYDGEYGVIKLFEEGELGRGSSAGLLFELPEEEKLKRAVDGEEQIAGEGARAPQEAKATPTRKKKKSAKKKKKAVAASGLDREQAKAAAITKGALLIVAGPGAGKTRTLTHRIARLVQVERVAPEACLAITFTRRAAAEMRERLIELMPDAGARVPVMTFHALGHSILTEQAARIGLPRRFRVIDERERISLLKAAVKDTGARAPGERKAKALVNEISKLKRVCARPDPDSDLAPIHAAYEQRLGANALVDFDDLLGRAVEILDSDPGALAHYRQRYQYLSIDEYQDVDETQYRLVKLLCPPDGNVCAIGDPDQAIYGFRGSDVGFFLRFTEDYPEARTIELTKNYRSQSSIVDASLQMITPTSLVSERSLDAVLDDAGRIVIQECPTDKAEAEFVVHTIERAIGGSTFFSMDSDRVAYGEGGDYSFGDFGVLYRTDAQARLLVEAFARSGIPYQKRSHGRITDDPGVEKLVAELGKMEVGASVFDAMVIAGGVTRATQGEELDDASVEAAIDLLTPLARRWGDDLHGFLSEVAMGASVDAWDPRAQRVSLLTLHAAKGLEFRTAFIVGCEDGLVPLRWGAAECEHLDEERRLFFVGMTRARARLYLSHANQRVTRGKSRKMAVSPFIRDVEERLLERVKSKGGKKGKGKGAEQLDLF